MVGITIVLSQCLLSKLGDRESFITLFFLHDIVHFFHSHIIEGVKQTFEILLISNRVTLLIAGVAREPLHSNFIEIFKFNGSIESLLWSLIGRHGQVTRHRIQRIL